MSLLANLGIDEESIEQSEASRQRAMVGRGLAGKKGQGRVTISIRKIAKDLIVSAVLLDDVNDLFEWGVLGRLGRPTPIVGSTHAPRESVNLPIDRSHRNFHQRSVQLSERISC